MSWHSVIFHKHYVNLFGCLSKGLSEMSRRTCGAQSRVGARATVCRWQHAVMHAVWAPRDHLCEDVHSAHDTLLYCIIVLSGKFLRTLSLSRSTLQTKTPNGPRTPRKPEGAVGSSGCALRYANATSKIPTTVGVAILL